MGQAVKDHYVSLNGLKFHYRDWDGAGKPLVLLHGLASTSHIFDMMLPHLISYCHPIALDQRGHGESDKPESGYDFDNFVNDLHAFINALGLERPVLLGHSWGGSVVLQYAATYPNVPRGIIMVDGGFLDLSSSPDATWERTEKELAPPDFTGMTKEALLERAKTWSSDIQWSAEREAILLANFSINPDGTIQPRLHRSHHMKILRALWEQRPPQLYPRVRCHVLMVPAWREPGDDRTARFIERKKTNLSQARELLPNSRTVEMHDTVHDIPVHRPRELAEAICQFLTGLP